VGPAPAAVVASKMHGLMPRAGEAARLALEALL